MSLYESTLTPTQEQKIHTPEQEWSDDFARKVVTADFQSAQEYRRYHDSRWELADRLYLGWEKQRVWEGTKIPRSSLGMFVVFQQVESLLPKILSAIFSDSPWFESDGQPGTTAKQAIAARGLLLYQLEQARRLNNQSVREVFRRAIKSGMIYGNGIIEMSWLDQVKKLKRHYRQNIPEMVPHPYDPSKQMPSGRYRSTVGEKFVEQRYQLPMLEYVSLKDFYIDPNCPGPQVQLARFAQKRALMTVDKLDGMRDQDGFKIPSRSNLIDMAKARPQRQADVTKSAAESARGQNWQPNRDTSLDPGARLIEVIADYRADRCVWLTNPGSTDTSVPIYNEKNEYGFIPYFNAFYTDVLDRFYGLAVTDVTEGEHRLQGAVINARIDELALSIHSARIKKRGASIPSYQLRRRPGQIIETENPKEDIVTEQTQNITQQAFIETDASQSRVQRTTGLNDLISSGTPTGGGNSANRTAAGINTQVAAGSSRIVYLVENIEDTFVEPLLTYMHQMNTIFLDPNEILHIVGQDIDPIDILNSDVQFTMRASSKMQSRMALLQSFPLIAQTFMNPELIASLHRQGKTVDLEELWTMLLDMTGYKTRGELVRPLTKEEQAALQQAQSQEPNVELVKQRERMQDMKELQSMKADATMQNTIAGKAMDLVKELQKPEGAPA